MATKKLPICDECLYVFDEIKCRNCEKQRANGEPPKPEINDGGVLRMLDTKTRIRDGRHASEMRCNCLPAPNLVAIVENGEVVFAGCPICRKTAIVEVLDDGQLGFFPMGTVVI